MHSAPVDVADGVAPGEPLLLVSDTSTEAERLIASLRVRGFKVRDVPLVLLPNRVEVQKPRLVICDGRPSKVVSVLERIRGATWGSKTEILLLGGDDAVVAAVRPFIADIATRIYGRPIDVYSVLQRIEEILGLPESVGGTAPRSMAALPRVAGPTSIPALPSASRNPTPIPRARRGAAGRPTIPPRSPDEAASCGRRRPSSPPASDARDRDLRDAAVAPMRMSAALEGLLGDAERRLEARANSLQPPSSSSSSSNRLSPEEELDAILPPELLAVLDESIDLDDDDDTSTPGPRVAEPRPAPKTRPPARTESTADAERTGGGAAADEDTGVGRFAARPAAPYTAMEAPERFHQTAKARPTPIPPSAGGRTGSAGTNPSDDMGSTPVFERGHATSVGTDAESTASIAGNSNDQVGTTLERSNPSNPSNLSNPSNPSNPSNADLVDAEDPNLSGSSTAPPRAHRSHSMAPPRIRLPYPPARISAGPGGPRLSSEPHELSDSHSHSPQRRPRVHGMVSLAPEPHSQPEQPRPLPAVIPEPHHRAEDRRTEDRRTEDRRAEDRRAESAQPAATRDADKRLPEIPQALGALDAVRALAASVRLRYTGVLVVEDEAGIRRVVLRDGDFVVVASGIDQESLVSFLIQRGDLKPEASRLGRKLPQFGRHAGAALIAHGYLRQDELWPVLRSHAEWLLGHTLSVTQGSAGLESELPARLSAEPAVFGGATGAEVLIEVVRRIISPEIAIAALGGPRARLAKGHESRLLSECALGPSETQMVERVSGQMLQEVLAESEAADFAAAVFCLVELGVLEALPASRHDASPVKGPVARDALDDAAIRSRVALRRALVDEGDYFSLLGISREATGYEVRHAYLALRREYDPGSLLTAATADLHAEVDLILEVLDEAYEILSDNARRSRYRRALEGTPA